MENMRIRDTSGLGKEIKEELESRDTRVKK